MKLWGVLVLGLSVACVQLTTVEGASAQPQSDAEARALFAAGEVAYGEGRYESALEYFQRAYELSQRPLLLYNVASAAEHLRLDQQALDAYRGYLAAVPDAENRAAVEARIAVIERALASSTSHVAVTPPPPDPEPTVEPPPAATAADTGPGVAPWVLVGVGGAVLVAGAVLVGVGMADVAAVTDAPLDSQWSDVRGAYDRAPILTGVGFACLGVGAAVAVTGIVWAVTGSSGGEQARTSPPSATAWVDPHGAGVAVWGSF